MRPTAGHYKRSRFEQLEQSILGQGEAVSAFTAKCAPASLPTPIPPTEVICGAFPPSPPSAPLPPYANALPYVMV